MSNIAAAPARSFIYKPFDGHIALKPTGVLLGKLAGDVGFRNMGNYENASYTIEKDEEMIWSPQTPERSKIGTLWNEEQVNLAFTMQQMVDLTRTAVMQSEPKLVFAQQAVADKPFEVVDLEAGSIYPLGVRDITEIDLGADYVEGVNYQMDYPMGHLEIIAHPGNVEKATVSGTYSAAAVAGRKVWGIASQLDLRGSIMFRSTNRLGPKQLVEFWDVGLSGDGEVALGANSSDQASVSVMGKVYAAQTGDYAFRYGRATDIPA